MTSFALRFLCSVLTILLSYGQSGKPTTLGDIAPKLREKTKIPLRIPAFFHDAGRTQIYSIVREASPEKYDILLATELPCEGQNNCLFGSLQGSRFPLEPIEGKASAIHLTAGIVGEFTPTRCYAYCNQAYIRWKENDVSYSIGIKAGRKIDLIAAAKSALAKK